MASNFKFSIDTNQTRKLTSRNGSTSSKVKSKYEAIQPKINSGYHVGKLMEDFELIQKNFRFKADEIFQRIKISLLVSLLTESVFLENQYKVSTETQANSNPEKLNPTYPFREEESLSFSPVTEHLKELKPYLLLDVRDAEEYANSHIITAVNYPKCMLSKGNFEIPLLLKYKNHKDYIIIIYDENESLAPQMATTLVERGYLNIFMLSGGLRVAKQCFPHSLIVNQHTNISKEISMILITQLQQMSFRFRNM